LTNFGHYDRPAAYKIDIKELYNMEDI